MFWWSCLKHPPKLYLLLSLIQAELSEATQLVAESVWQLDRGARELATLKEEVGWDLGFKGCYYSVAVGLLTKPSVMRNNVHVTIPSQLKIPPFAIAVCHL